MKIKKRDLKLIVERYLNEMTPDIISPGSDVDAARRQSEYMSKNMTMGTVQAITEIIVGFTPAGVVIDVKDLTLALKKIYESGGDEGKIDVALAGIGFLPGAGDAFVKAFKRAFKKADSNPFGLSAEQISKMSPGEYDEMVEAAVDSAKKKHPDKIQNNVSAEKRKKYDPDEVPTTAELNKYIKPSPPDTRKINMSVTAASAQAGYDITEDNVIAGLRHFRNIDDYAIYVVEDPLGNFRAFYKSTGTGTPEFNTRGNYYEIDGFGRMESREGTRFTWFVKTQQKKLPTEGSIDELIGKRLKVLDASGELPPASGESIVSEGGAQGVIQSAIFNNGLKEMGVNTDLADATLRNFVYHKGTTVDNMDLIHRTYESR